MDFDIIRSGDDNFFQKLSSTLLSSATASARPALRLLFDKTASLDFDASENINRRANPLSKLMSYTYVLTLYMMNSSTLNKFYQSVEAGQQVNPASMPGAYIIGQSGGINNKTESRALTLSGNLGKAGDPGNVGYDFHIDDLTMKLQMPDSGDLKVSTALCDIDFNITEPGGFSFRFALEQAARTLLMQEAGNRKIGEGEIEAVMSQMPFVMGIKFYGYDINGKMITADLIQDVDHKSGLSDRFALYERFFSMQIKRMTFKVDGKNTVYSVSGVSFREQAAYSEMNNAIPVNINCQGSTVGETLNNLMASMNNLQKTQRTDNQRDEVNEYEVIFAPGSENIAYAKFKVDPEQAPTTKPDAGDKNPSPVGGVRAQTTNPNLRTFSVSAGTTLVKMIENIVSASSYLSDAVNTSTDTKPETNSKSKENTKEFTWYTVVPKIRMKPNFDQKTQTFSFKIAYVITKLKTPMVRSNYVNATTEFYGPNKIYDYYYTGMNTEVKRLDFEFENSMFMQTPITPGKDNTENKRKIPQMPTSAMSADPTYSRNNDNIYQQSLLANLYNSSDNRVLQMEIAGDPDLFWGDVEMLNFNNQRYGKFSPIDGQVFIELRMRGATDYDPVTGLKVITKNPTTMYRDPKILEKLRAFRSEVTDNYETDNDVGPGLIYKLNKVISKFRNGQFTQEFEDSILFDEENLRYNLGLDKESQTTNTGSTGSATGGSREPLSSSSPLSFLNSGTVTPSSIFNIPYSSALPESFKPDPLAFGGQVFGGNSNDDQGIPSVGATSTSFGSTISSFYNDFSRDPINDDGSFPARDEFLLNLSAPL